MPFSRALLDRPIVQRSVFVGHRMPLVRNLATVSSDSQTKIGAESSIKPLRPTPNIITASDLRGYVDLLTPLIDSLYRDVHDNMPSADAATLRKEAKALEDSMIGDLEASKAYAAKLRAQADAIETKGLSASQIAALVSFVKEIDAFYLRWTAQRKETIAIIMGWPVPMTSGGDWTKLQGYDLEFQTLARRYESFGFTLSQQIPPSAPDTPGIPWMKVGIGLGVVAILVVGGLVIYNRTSVAPSSPTPPTPQPAHTPAKDD